jgi:hypothetical protein
VVRFDGVGQPKDAGRHECPHEGRAHVPPRQPRGATVRRWGDDRQLSRFITG